MEFAASNDLPVPGFYIAVVVAADEKCRGTSGILIRERILILAALHFIPGALIGVEQQAGAVRVLAKAGPLIACF